MSDDTKENPRRGDGSGLGKNLSKCYGISASSQRQRIIPALLKAGAQGLTTIQMRKPPLDILHPPARILELRKLGYRIDTMWTWAETEAGQLHRVARYVLLGLPTNKQFSDAITRKGNTMSIRGAL